MDTRRLITAVLVTMMAVFAFQVLLDWIGERQGWRKPRPDPAAQRDPASPATAPTTAPLATVTPPATRDAPTIAAASIRAAPPDTPQPASVQLGSAARNDPTWRMAVDLVPEGAAIERVVLNQFTRAVESDDPYVFQRPLADQSWTRSMTTRSIVIDGVSVNLDSISWTLESSDSASATFVVTLENDDGPLVRVRKSYQLTALADPSEGYEVVVAHSLENLTAKAVSARLVTNGPVTPPREVDRGPDRYIVSGYQQDPLRMAVTHHAIEELTPEQQTIDITRLEDYPLRWAGALSVYFVAIARPAEPEVAAQIAQAQAVAFNPNTPPFERDAGVVFHSRDLELQPGQSTALPLRVFFGPRQRRLLQQDYYADLGYNEILVLTAGPCGWCTFQWLINLLVMLLRGFHFIFRDWGLAIIALVVLVRIILHPITKKSQVSMMKMSKLGPEIERLRKKHGDNKEELNKAMMGFYKEQGFTPVLGCLPMFLQMPIWIALWSALNSTFELRQASFLWGYTWIKDLARPDHLIEFRQPFDIFFLHISGINLLPILMGVVFYLQMKLQPRPVSMTKEQEQQQKIMMWMMPFLFPLMLYSGPSGLNLYILTSTFIGIIESKRIRDHVKQQEEAEKEGRVIVDAGATRGMKRRRDDEGPGHGAARLKGPPPPKTGLGGWLQNLQAKVEEIRREADKRKS